MRLIPKLFALSGVNGAEKEESQTLDRSA